MKHDKEGEIVVFEEEDKKILMNGIIAEQFAKRSFRSIVCAYKDLTKEEYNDLATWHQNFKQKESLYKAFSDELTLIAIFAIDDPLREGIDQSV